MNLSEFSKKGGKAGKGDSKRRLTSFTSASSKAALKARWAKTKRKPRASDRRSIVPVRGDCNSKAKNWNAFVGQQAEYAGRVLVSKETYEQIQKDAAQLWAEQSTLNAARWQTAESKLREAKVIIRDIVQNLDAANYDRARDFVEIKYEQPPSLVEAVQAQFDRTRKTIASND